jgi:hypothetical protein
MIKRLCYKILRLGEQWQKEQMRDDGIRPATNLERMFGDCSPAIVAFRIDNGYVMRSIDFAEKNTIGGSEVSGYVYCKDHAAIAEHIVSEAARTKLGLGSPSAQKSMNYGSKAVAYRP